MDPMTLIVRSVCAELGVSSPIETYRVQTKVLAQLATLFGGEEVRFYVPKLSIAERAKRHRAILAERAAGEPVAVVAARHGVTTRRVNQMLAAQRVSPAGNPAQKWTV